ncbi:LysR family transcriptional regulator [Pseudacidovorax intermedius]|uniref:LysR family transcriptional regulator n=1 Tax=Pseudacidovorax intermedius TaxID=433924 RepID=UPI0026F0AB14|nr:LysR family transcriptional regulator [Pseudacidovorax intermedius]
MNLTMRQIRAFLSVAQSGSFTRAAERVHMTQAGLSILVREVEKQLGARLFDRTTRAVQLTEAGRRFAAVAENVLQQLDDAGTEVGALGQRTRQQLRIAATPLVSSHLLPQMLARFSQAQPEVRIQLMDSDLQGVQALVESGAADIGLGFFFKVSAGLVRRQIAEFALMKVSPADEAPAALGRSTWTSLRGTRLITLPTENPIQRSIDTHLHRLGIVPAETQPVSFIATMISMVEAGFGSAVIPTFAVAACRRHRVAMEVLGSPQLKLGFYRVSRRGAAQTAAMQAFDEVLVELLPTMSR